MRRSAIKRITCLVRGHRWRLSPFSALNAPNNEFTFVCDRCGKQVNRYRSFKR